MTEPVNLKGHIGFTGTQAGLTYAQYLTLGRILDHFSQRYKSRYFHHGCCIGADCEGNTVAEYYGYTSVAHPPINKKKVFKDWEECDIILEEKDYLNRNLDIVDSSYLIIGCPKQDHEVVRSGTWATLRWARSTHKHIIIIWPDGSISRGF